MVEAAASVIVEEVVSEEVRAMLVDFLPLLCNSLKQDETIRMLQEELVSCSDGECSSCRWWQTPCVYEPGHCEAPRQHSNGLRHVTYLSELGCKAEL